MMKRLLPTTSFLPVVAAELLHHHHVCMKRCPATTAIFAAVMTPHWRHQQQLQHEQRRTFLTGTTGIRLQSQKKNKHMSRVRPAEAPNPLSKPFKIDQSVFYVVAVPIGNVKDFTLRALEVLKQVDYIVCANRRATKVLLDLVSIDYAGRLIHYQGSQTGNNSKIADMIKTGRSVAFVVPGGTPCVGDEGAQLVREMQNTGIRVSAIPGACSVTAALAMSGCRMEDGSFTFGGSLIEHKKDRRRQVAKAQRSPGPTVFLEHPNSLEVTLTEIAAIMPQRRVTVLHEITKVHESTHSGEALEMKRYYSMSSSKRLLQGQLVLIIEGADLAELYAIRRKELLSSSSLQNSRNEEEGSINIRNGGGGCDDDHMIGPADRLIRLMTEHVKEMGKQFGKKGGLSSVVGGDSVGGGNGWGRHETEEQQESLALKLASEEVGCPMEFAKEIWRQHLSSSKNNKHPADATATIVGGKEDQDVAAKRLTQNDHAEVEEKFERVGAAAAVDSEKSKCDDSGGQERKKKKKMMKAGTALLRLRKKKKNTWKKKKIGFLEEQIEFVKNRAARKRNKLEWTDPSLADSFEARAMEGRLPLPHS